MDFPRAWQIARASNDSEHDPRCSWIADEHGLLCDCHVITLHPEYDEPPKLPISTSQARALAAAARENTAAGLEAREQLPDVVCQLAAEVELARRVRLAPAAAQHLVDKRVHTTARVRAYLVAKGYVCERQHARSSDWKHPKSREPVHLLDDDGFSDYAKVIGFLIQDLADFLCVGEMQVLADIAEAGDA